MSQCRIVGTDLLIEFLQVAFNEILYQRKIYPEEAFVKKKIYASAVHVSQHPELNEYLDNVCSAIRQSMLNDESNIRAINLVVFGKEQRIVEKYVFNIGNVRADGTESDPYFFKLEQLLRGLCLKLAMTPTYLKPLADESSFVINIETRQRAYLAIRDEPALQHFPWVSSDDENEAATTAALGTLFPDIALSSDTNRSSSILPLTAIKNQHLSLEMFVVVENNDS